MTRQTPADDGGRTAELWMRADVPGGGGDRQERLRERTTSVDAFADVRTRMVPDRLSLSGVAADSPGGSALRETVMDAREWAVSTGVDLGPYLPISEECSIGFEEARRVLTFPTVTLVEYDAVDDVARVTPHVDDGRVVSVEARLDALEASLDVPERVLAES
ncbi:hypothetical protein G9C85_01915 [Halorubellus sp. JP-L1]|uniref:HTH domain-containing protein n=1 Tax=Halorubellus sp. JP-L1 TaxID=2715753 RepID=UPI0014099311|nr:HTH domain-containing protein [Halorubellus sp. JP-L1]NHN40393.1 hypothetical protein [Halorubellus sp. JP-L1]